MELKVKTLTFPEAIDFNFDELKQEITERASAYVNLVYTDDQIAEAKKDRAALNKFVKALSDERIKIKKECLKPYEDFEAKIKILDEIVSKAVGNIDSQIKAVEEREKTEKREKIKELWENIEHPEEMTFEHVFEAKFLNKSCSLATVEQYIRNSIARFSSALAALRNLPEFSFEAIEVYKHTQDMHKAISEGKRLAEIQKRKAEQEVQKREAAKIDEAPPFETAAPAKEPDAEIPAEASPKQLVKFAAYLSVEDAQALKAFFESRQIEFKAI